MGAFDDDWADDAPQRRQRWEPARPAAQGAPSAPATPAAGRQRIDLTLEPPRTAAGSRRFARTFWSTLAVLAVLSGTFAVIGSTRGPRLDSAQLATDALVSAAGSRLLLTVDQPIAPIDAADVTVEPAASVTVASDDRSITVTFDELLRYDTEYEVRVSGVDSTATGRTGELVHTFTTPDPELFLLDRGDADAPDVIRRTTLAGAADEVVFTADRIQEFARTADGLAVVTLEADDSPAVTRVLLEDGVELPVALPGEGRVSELAASPQGVFGFVFSPATGEAGRLVVHDEADQSGVGTELLGTGGPIGVSDWHFVPGTTSVVLQDDENNLSLIDTLAPEQPTPLGIHTEVRGFVPGTLDLVVANPTGGARIDLATGEQQPLVLPTPELDPALETGRVLIADDAGAYLQQVIGLTAEGQALSALVFVDESGASPFSITPSSTGSSVRDFCLSPNGQYAAVEIISVEGEPDRYPGESAHTAMSTIFVDLSTGSVTRSVAGFAPQWC
jgi:hypothetical protein